MGIIITLVYLALIVAFIAGMWVLTTRAGKPGWYALVPILNLFNLAYLSGKQWWWALLLFVPFLNIVIGILMFKAFLENYGERELVMIVVGIVFSFIYIPYMAFSKKSTYQPIHPAQFKLDIGT